jgi:hypothetical protein
MAALAGFARGSRPALAAGSARLCDAPIYFGVLHCVHVLGGSLIHVLIVDLTDPRVSFELALPALNPAAGQAECDNTRRCGDGFYPFESVPHMLQRRSAAGAVGGINTDYFGLSYRPDHGAEGIAVRNGQRLDDPDGPELVGHTSLAISRRNEASLLWVGPRNAGLDLQGRHYTVAGGGPQIVEDGRPLENDACRNDRLHIAVCNRMFETAAGLTGRELVMAVARNLDTAGIAAFLADEYGVSSAIKFDGGGSAQMAWLDAEGQVAGFDASDKTDGGFRRVAEGLLVYSRPVTPLLAADFHGQVLDDSSTFFARQGEWPGWQVDTGVAGIGQSFAWTANSRIGPEPPWGEWSIAAGARGTYQIYAHVPAGHATSRTAHYEIRHAGQTSLVVVDQRAAAGSWVLLGTFQLAGQGDEYVRLSSATGEAYATTQVAFDAIGLVKIG